MATVSKKVSTGSADSGSDEATGITRSRNNHGDMILNRISSSRNKSSVFVTQPGERHQNDRKTDSDMSKNTDKKNGGNRTVIMENPIKRYDPRDVRARDYDRHSATEDVNVRSAAYDNDNVIDYKAIKKEAKTEFKRLKENATKKYERRLGEARGEFLRDAVSNQEKYRNEMHDARDEMEKIVVQAREQYEFTLDIVRDLNDVSKEDISSIRSK